MPQPAVGLWDQSRRWTFTLRRELIPLTPVGQETVRKIAENVFRPCCGNSTAFPDCNHGMAALAYIELAVSQGLPEKQIYKDLLGLNSFWFPSTYVEMAVYFKKIKIRNGKMLIQKPPYQMIILRLKALLKLIRQSRTFPELKAAAGAVGPKWTRILQFHF